MDNEIIIKQYLKNVIQLNDYRITQEYDGIHEHQDIESEFVKYIQNDFENIDMIIVEGYSVKKLVDEFPLSVLGAYNYLIYLRTNPSEALLDLQKGLPRK